MFITLRNIKLSTCSTRAVLVIGLVGVSIPTMQAAVKDILKTANWGKLQGNWEIQLKEEKNSHLGIQ